MIDITERLRARSWEYMGDAKHWELRDEAADEIERLRRELAEAVTALPQAVRNERERCAALVESRAGPLRTGAYDALIAAAAAIRGA